MSFVVVGGGGGGGGSDGGSYPGAAGGSAAQVTVNNFAVTAGNTIDLFVGSGGGAGTSSGSGGTFSAGGGGGGASQVTVSLVNVIVAGGGGGGGGIGASGSGGSGGAGGLAAGATGGTYNSYAGGSGGSNGTGGAGATWFGGPAPSGSNGSGGSGGVGGANGGAIVGGVAGQGSGTGVGGGGSGTSGAGGGGYGGGGGGINGSGGGAGGSTGPAGASYAAASNAGTATSAGGDGSITITFTVTAAATVTPPPIPDNVALPGVTGIGSQLTVLDLTSGSGPSMTTCLVGAVKQLFGAEASYVGQSANGAAQILVGGQTISFYPLEASTGTGLGVGAFPRNDNPLTVGTSCGTFGVAPAVANIADLGRALAALGLDVQVDAKGVFTAMVDNQLYVVRPDYFVTQGIATGTPSLVFGADGVLRFTDSAGKEQILHPAFLDPAALQAAVVAALGQYGYLTIQTDGSGVFTRFNGSQLVLTPEMVLSGAPNGFGSAKVVNDGLNRYLYLIAAYYQGVTATAR